MDRAGLMEAADLVGGAHPYLFFSKADLPALREKMKREIQSYLSSRDERWPSWFIVSDDLRYQEKRQWLNEQYERFIRPPRPLWMPAALHDRELHRVVDQEGADQQRDDRAAEPPRDEQPHRPGNRLHRLTPARRARRTPNSRRGAWPKARSRSGGSCIRCRTRI